MRQAATLRHRTVLILSGPTREHFDPVRFISNASTGKMGKALAEAALAAGAKVEFVTGPVADQHLPGGRGMRAHRVVSAVEMLAAARKLFPAADIAIFAAAVADYAPAARAARKLPKQGRETVLRLRPTPDIAKTLSARKRPGQVTIGFALETHGGPAKARAKLKSKRFDAIILNSEEAVGADRGTYTFIRSEGSAAQWGALTKKSCAARIIRKAAALLHAGRAA